MALGQGDGVALFGARRLAGFPAWLAWRGYYLTQLMGFKNRLGVLVEWTSAYFGHRVTARLDVSETMRTPAAASAPDSGRAAPDRAVSASAALAGTADAATAMTDATVAKPTRAAEVHQDDEAERRGRDRRRHRGEGERRPASRRTAAASRTGTARRSTARRVCRPRRHRRRRRHGSSDGVADAGSAAVAAAPDSPDSLVAPSLPERTQAIRPRSHFSTFDLHWLCGDNM